MQRVDPVDGSGGAAPADKLAQFAGQPWKPGEGTIHEAIYKTDAFRINSFKILSCSNRGPHDWCVLQGG